jgi:hypothetical protein
MSLYDFLKSDEIYLRGQDDGKGPTRPLWYKFGAAPFCAFEASISIDRKGGKVCPSARSICHPWTVAEAELFLVVELAMPS